MHSKRKKKENVKKKGAKGRDMERLEEASKKREQTVQGKKEDTER